MKIGKDNYMKMDGVPLIISELRSVLVIYKRLVRIILRI